MIEVKGRINGGARRSVVNFKANPELNACVKQLDGAAFSSREANLALFRNWLSQRKYSVNTIKVYLDALRIFFRFFEGKEIQSLSNHDFQFFISEYIIKQHLSASYQNQVVNAMKLYCVRMAGMQMDFAHLIRPRRPQLLPNVLSKKEVKLILFASSNLKHRAMLCLLYSCGLRCGELLNLRLEHIDEQQMSVVVMKPSSNHVRYVPLSNKVLKILKVYCADAQPKKWLFEGKRVGEMYDARSLQLVMKRCVEKVKIERAVNLNWLRHSYAFHLLEAGTDVKYVQQLMGHGSSKTTEVYQLLSKREVGKIASPFDLLGI